VLVSAGGRRRRQTAGGNGSSIPKQADGSIAQMLTAVAAGNGSKQSAVVETVATVHSKPTSFIYESFFFVVGKILLLFRIM